MKKLPCAIDGCKKTVDIEWCLCGDHYRMIPDHLRIELVRCYNSDVPRERQNSPFYVSLAKVHGWIAETFGQVREPKKESWESVVAMVRARDAARCARRGEVLQSFDLTPL